MRLGWKFTITKTAMTITDALLGMDTVTCETSDKVSLMKTTGGGRSEVRDLRVSIANDK